MNQFEKTISDGRREGLYSEAIDVIQVNVGLFCNQACMHCHLAASPDSEEVMTWPVMEKVLDIAGSVRPGMVDITGGAPELNPHLKRFINGIAALGIEVQVRTNLTALVKGGTGDLAGFFQDKGVRLVGSLPCYLEENVRNQRGDGVYEKSIEAVRRLNELGYGRDPDLILNLVYNPGGAFLPGDQTALEADYKRELDERFGITFTNLLTITNMPIGRFGQTLRSRKRYDKYMRLLTDAFNPGTVPGLMCRRQISIGWDGTLYDCDFNLAMHMVMNHGAPDHIDRWDHDSVEKRRIVTGDHCFGCTAGRGSSCGGALAENPA